MPITNYTELQAALSTWMGRDVSSYAPDLILLGEQRIFFGSEDPTFPSDPLRIRAMENFTDPTTFTTSAGSERALPTGFLGLTKNRTLYLNTDPIKPLEHASDDQISALQRQGNGEPIAYTVRGESLRFGPAPDAAYGVVMGYYKRFDPLATTATNWLLTNAPGVYLYAALLEAQALIRNDARLPVWASMYTAAVRAVQKADDMDRWSGRLTMRPAGSTP